MNASSPPTSPQALRSPPGAQRARAQQASHRYTMPATREMTPAETEAQRRLVRASILAKPV
jgi:hypothetical protein